MAQKPFTSETVEDALASFEAGMNSGNAPLLLPKNQLAMLTNGTVRGAYVTHRPPFNKQTLDFQGNVGVQTAFLGGLWQGANYYKPDTGMERLICSISGRLFQLTPTIPDTTWLVDEISIPGDLNSATETQAWLWQAEKWMIVTDGTISLPIFFDGTSSRRSIGNNQADLTITTTVPASGNVPASGGFFTVTLAVAPIFPLGTIIIGTFGEYTVTNIAGANVTLQRNNSVGQASGTALVVPAAIYSELPAGRMGCYGMDRVWMSLIDGKQFMAGDICGGPSGTLANNFRDAVLHSSENTYLAGGGNFTTPGAWGDIRAMIFATTLDVSLGQGPLQVLTPTKAFSCYAPTDRTTWASVTNPILTESLITNGAESHYGTVSANGDLLFRAVDGIRSLILGRREFQTWGNTPISNEMDRVLQLDIQNLLKYSSAIVFENRLLMTASPVPVAGRGVYHQGIVAMNFDPLSSLRGKAPSVYDGLWTGLYTLQLVMGRFDSTERGFGFTYNTASQEIELYEILTTPADAFISAGWLPDGEIYDNISTPIIWAQEGPILFKAQDPSQQNFHRMLEGEVLVDNLQGTVDFAAYYKPDQYPCWVPWFSWSECAKKSSDLSKPQFRPRLGLGEPSGKPCDPSTNRPLREGYMFQFRLVVRGHCRVLGARFKAVSLPQQVFAKQSCLPLCSPISQT